MQIIEADLAGNPWLLSIVNISPDQEEPFIVRLRLVDTKNGDTFTPLDEFYNRDSILTSREIEILKNISQLDMHTERMNPATEGQHQGSLIQVDGIVVILPI